MGAIDVGDPAPDLSLSTHTGEQLSLADYRGKHPVFWALRNGEKTAGLTVHAMDPGLDTGDILYQVRVRTRRCDSVSSLYGRIMDRSEKLVPQLVAGARDGKLRRRRQPRAGASYYSSTSEEDFRLDWLLDSETLRRRVSTSPGKCFFEVKNNSIVVLTEKSFTFRYRWYVWWT